MNNNREISYGFSKRFAEHRRMRQRIRAPDHNPGFADATHNERSNR